MADFDVKNDTTPVNANSTARGTSVAALKSALSTFNATSYSAARLQTMTKQDMRYAVRLHGLSVAGV